eukprot:Pgem_evm2s10633
MYLIVFLYSFIEQQVGPSGMWTTLFIFSKIPELFDTMFIVLRKRPLIFLHWYHHITVLAYCWHAYATRASSVHAVMVKNGT